MAHDVDAEVVEAVRSTLQAKFGRFIGMIATEEAGAVVDELQRQGLVLVPIGDDPVPVDDAAATLMTVNINVTATPDTLDAVLEQVRASGLAP